jgi:hypothetical protein
MIQIHKISIHFHNHSVQCSFIIFVLVNWIGYDVVVVVVVEFELKNFETCF